MNKSLIFAIVAVIAVVIAIIIALQFRGGDEEVASVEAVAKQSISKDARIIKVTAKKFEFEPSEIRVSRGEKVVLNIQSVDVEHGFEVPDFGINEKVQPGKTTTIEFTADKVGEFKFLCSVFCGTGHNEMTGKIIVE